MFVNKGKIFIFDLRLGTQRDLGERSSMGRQFHFDICDDNKVFKSGRILNLGKHTWQFITLRELLLLINLISTGTC